MEDLNFCEKACNIDSKIEIMVRNTTEAVVVGSASNYVGSQITSS